MSLLFGLEEGKGFQDLRCPHIEDPGSRCHQSERPGAAHTWAHLARRSQELQPHPLRSRCLDTHISTDAASQLPPWPQIWCSDTFAPNSRGGGACGAVHFFQGLAWAFWHKYSPGPFLGPSQGVPHGQKDLPLSLLKPLFFRKAEMGLAWTDSVNPAHADWGASLTRPNPYLGELTSLHPGKSRLISCRRVPRHCSEILLTPSP